MSDTNPTRSHIRLAKLANDARPKGFDAREASAAARIRNLSESLDEMVRDQEDLTRFADIGEAIASAIRECCGSTSHARFMVFSASACPKNRKFIFVRLRGAGGPAQRQYFVKGSLDKHFRSRRKESTLN